MKKEQFGGFIDKYRIEIISKPSWMIVESIRVFRINLCREGQKLDNNRKKKNEKMTILNSGKFQKQMRAVRKISPSGLKKK